MTIGGGDAWGVLKTDVSLDAPLDVRWDVGTDETGVASADGPIEYVEVTGEEGGESDGCGVSGDAGGSLNSTKAASSSSLSTTGTPGAHARCQPSGWKGIRCIGAGHEEGAFSRTNDVFVITRSRDDRRWGDTKARKGAGFDQKQ